MLTSLILIALVIVMGSYFLSSLEEVGLPYREMYEELKRDDEEHRPYRNIKMYEELMRTQGGGLR